MPEYLFGTRDAAKEARSIAFSWLDHDATDWRSKRVVVEWNCPDDVQRLLEAREFHSQQEKKESYGQADLTAYEKDHIDFSETNLFHAMSVKAIAAAHDERDWIAKYDPTLTVDEHREVYEEQPRRHSR